MTIGSPWFPDLLAGWYDDLAARRLEADVDRWRYTRPRLVDQWTHELSQAPHTTAARIQQELTAEIRDDARAERTFRALQAASSAFERVGVSPPLEYGGFDWAEIRQRWSDHGNLAREASGVVLPRRRRRYGWQGTRPEPKVYHPGSMFAGFLRPPVPRDLVIAFRAMPDPEVPIESIGRQLRLAVAPLVESMAELEFKPVDEASGRRAFRVGLIDPKGLAAKAMQTVELAGRLQCDVVLFPELCLSPDGQSWLQSSISRSSRPGGRPWLILAGSAFVPVPGGGGYYNRALVLDGRGQERLVHHKLHPYEMSAREADRYGIGEALNREPRVEDIVVHPRRLEILECALGRTAVLICEDLSNFNTFGPIAQDFEIDWLLVPVMDGVQTTKRWTARYAIRFAEDFGTNVLVGTCAALVSAHRAELINTPAGDPGGACGLLAQLSDFAVSVVPILPDSNTPSLAMFELRSS